MSSTVTRAMNLSLDASLVYLEASSIKSSTVYVSHFAYKVVSLLIVFVLKSHLVVKEDSLYHPPNL